MSSLLDQKILKGVVTMIVICDMDEVICDFTDSMLYLYNKERHTDVKKEQLTNWALPEDLKDIFMNTNNFFTELPPIDGAIEFVKELHNISDELYIASCPSGSARIAKEKFLWMKIWLPELVDNLVLTSNKQILKGDCIIDDNPNHLKKFPGIPIVMDRPWNREPIENEYRIYDTDYNKILKFLNSYATLY